MSKGRKKADNNNTKTNQSNRNTVTQNATDKEKGKKQTPEAYNNKVAVKLEDIKAPEIDVNNLKFELNEKIQPSSIDASLSDYEQAMWELSEDAQENGYANVDSKGNVVATYTDILQEFYTNGNKPFIDVVTLDNIVGVINSKDYEYSKYQEDDEGKDKKEPQNNTTEIDVIPDDKQINGENFTDPIVLMPNKSKAGIVAVPASVAPPDINKDGKVEKDDNNNYEVNKYINSTNWPFFQMGVVYPLINLNGYLVPEREIAYFNLMFDDIVPRIELALYDKGITSDTRKQILFDSAATTTVIIRPQINGAYKSIHLDFRISSSDVNEDNYNGQNVITYVGLLKNEKLYDKKPLSIQKSKSSGVIITGKDLHKENDLENSPNNVAQPAKNSNPYYINTYDTIYSIAEETGFGFQCTDKCIEIEDNNFRFKRAEESYINLIRRTLNCGGCDENSVFDCWINMHGYFTLVNVSWILQQVKTITPQMLTIKAHIGTQVQSDGNEIESKWVKTYRTLTNLNTNTLSNMTFNNMLFSRIDDPNYVENGTFKTFQSCTLDGVKQSDNAILSMKQSNIRLIDISVDSFNDTINETNDINVTTDIQMNMSIGEVDTQKQRKIVTSFFELKRAHTFSLILTTVNFGLDRGMLVSIMYFVTNISEKRFIIQNIKNISGDPNIEKPVIQMPKDVTEEKIIEDPNYPLPDFSRSGIYYIDKMYIHFDSTSKQLMQKFELIKLGNVSTYQNAYSSMHLSKQESKDLEEFKAQEFTNYNEPTEGGDKFDAILDDIIDGWERDEKGNIKTDKDGNRIDRYGYNQDKAEKEYKEYAKKVEAAEIQREIEKKEAEKRAAEESKKAAAKAATEAKKAETEAKKQGKSQKTEEKSAETKSTETTNKEQKKVTIPVHTAYDKNNKVLYITNDDLKKTNLKSYFDSKGNEWVKLNDGRTVRVMSKQQANVFYSNTKLSTKIDTSTHDYYQQQANKTQQNLAQVVKTAKQRNYGQDVVNVLPGNVQVLRNGKVAYSSIPANNKSWSKIHGQYINNGQVYDVDLSK